MARHRNKSLYAKNSVMANGGIWGPVVIIQAAKTPEELELQSRKERALNGLNKRWEVIVEEKNKENDAIAK